VVNSTSHSALAHPNEALNGKIKGKATGKLILIYATGTINGV
jgi:hypothetical protein